ncbi:MAG: hypothetical protein QOG07_3526, partial [Pseudonocardiales bacterium]|nr:hypothetical protein [Pseudonocardiales bacterium]
GCDRCLSNQLASQLPGDGRPAFGEKDPAMPTP